MKLFERLKENYQVIGGKEIMFDGDTNTYFNLKLGDGKNFEGTLTDEQLLAKAIKVNAREIGKVGIRDEYRKMLNLVLCVNFSVEDYDYLWGETCTSDSGTLEYLKKHYPDIIGFKEKQ